MAMSAASVGVTQQSAWRSTKSGKPKNELALFLLYYHQISWTTFFKGRHSPEPRHRRRHIRRHVSNHVPLPGAPTRWHITSYLIHHPVAPALIRMTSVVLSLAPAIRVHPCMIECFGASECVTRRKIGRRVKACRCPEPKP